MNIQPSLCDTSVHDYWKDHSFGYTDFCPQSVSHVQPFVTPWTVTHQAPLPVGISQARILKWVAIFFSRDHPNPGIKPESPALTCFKQSLSHWATRGSPLTGVVTMKVELWSWERFDKEIFCCWRRRARGHLQRSSSSGMRVSTSTSEQQENWDLSSTKAWDYIMPTSWKNSPTEPQNLRIKIKTESANTLISACENPSRQSGVAHLKNCDNIVLLFQAS